MDIYISAHQIPGNISDRAHCAQRPPTMRQIVLHRHGVHGLHLNRPLHSVHAADAADAVCARNTAGDRVADTVCNGGDTAADQSGNSSLNTGEDTGRIFGLIPGQQQYATRQEALEDPALRIFCCPWCGGDVACESWVHFGHGTFAAYGLCPQEDECLVQLFPARRREAFAEKRMVFELTDDLWDIYLDKKETAQGAIP